MTYEFVLEKSTKKTFFVKRKVKVEVRKPVKRMGKTKKHVHFSELPEVTRPTKDKLPIVDGKPVEVIEVEVDQEYETLETVLEDVEEDAVEVAEANVIRMADAHNDPAHHRMFMHFVVGRYVDQKFQVPDKSDGLVFGGTEYMKRGYHEMLDLDEKKLLMDVVGYFGWKGDFLEVVEPAEFHDSGATA